MKRVEARLDDAVVAKITDSGKSVYQFVREAVEEKIQNDKYKKELNEFEALLEHRLKKFEKEVEEKMLRVLEIHIDERRSVEQKFDELVQKNEVARDQTKAILDKIGATLLALQQKQ